MVKCAVLGCNTNQTFQMFKFPNPQNEPGRFCAWLRASGNVALLDLAPMTITHRKICYLHFAKTDFTGSRLGTCRVPSLNLPEPLVVGVDWLQLKATVDVADINIDVKLPSPDRNWEKYDYDNKSLPIYVPTPTETIYVPTPPETIYVPTPTETIYVPTPTPQLNVPDEVETEFAETYMPAGTSDIEEEEQLVPQKAPESFIRKSNRPSLTSVQVRKLKRQVIYHKNKQATLKKKLCAVKRKLKGIDDLSYVQQSFIYNQLKNLNKKRAGRRFDIDFKVMSLSLFKLSPKAYKMLSQTFILPHPNTLLSLLSRIPVTPGICESVFRNLKRQVSKMTRKDRICVLMFDEISLSAHFDYDKHQDSVTGFADNGKYRDCNIAENVQVFMLRGVYKKWKQTIAYTFCKSFTKVHDFKDMYTQIVLGAESIGLNIIASVCDQGICEAIDLLKEETRTNALKNGEIVKEGVIKIGNNEIIPLYDPPHLLKSIRNNLLTKDLQFTIDGVTMVAKWSHIQDAYYIDAESTYRVMPNLSEHHINPKKMRKMKVSTCAQVFSRTVAAFLGFMSKCCEGQVIHGRKVLPEFTHTARLCEFLDDLFDSVNGVMCTTKDGKILRMPVTGKSKHQSIWIKAHQIFESMRFIPRPGGNNHDVRPPVFTNWVSTLNGFCLIKQKLLDLGYKSFPARSFNQDPLVHFFIRVRQHGARDPTCSAFGPYFKSLLVNNFIAAHSVGSTRQTDDCTGVLTSLTGFVNREEEEVGKVWEKQPVLPESFDPLMPLESWALGYVVAWTSKRLQTRFVTCDVCKGYMSRPDDSPLSMLDIVCARGYNNSERLRYCNESFVSFLSQVFNISHFLFPYYFHQPNLHFNLKSFISANVHFPFPPCPNRHNLKDRVISSFVRLLILDYTKLLNLFLTGKPPAKQQQTTDILQEQCRIYHLKKRKRRC